MKKEMLINVLQPEECRIAIVENGVLEELYVERTSHESYTGNIYKGKVVNLEPAIQAAFVDFSVGRNGFLHVSDVEPQYYGRNQPPADEAEGPASPGAGPRPRDPRRSASATRERRRTRPDPLGEPLPPSLPSPPRAEDRPRERERDRDRERERPDRSVRGRRDRSEMPRTIRRGARSRTETSPRPRTLPSQPLSKPRPRPAWSRGRTSINPRLMRGRRTSAGAGKSTATRAGAGPDRPRDRDFRERSPRNRGGGRHGRQSRSIPISPRAVPRGRGSIRRNRLHASRSRRNADARDLAPAFPRGPGRRPSATTHSGRGWPSPSLPSAANRAAGLVAAGSGPRSPRPPRPDRPSGSTRTSRARGVRCSRASGASRGVRIAGRGTRFRASPSPSRRTRRHPVPGGRTGRGIGSPARPHAPSIPGRRAPLARGARSGAREVPQR